MKPDAKVTGVGDSGLAWLRRSYQRCVEQAREEGRSVEELAAERWGVSYFNTLSEDIREIQSYLSFGLDCSKSFLEINEPIFWYLLV